jgi:hypothetical protein
VDLRLINGNAPKKLHVREEYATDQKSKVVNFAGGSNDQDAVNRSQFCSNHGSAGSSIELGPKHQLFN